MRLKVLRADPAGNITLFVLSPVEKEYRAALAEKLMALEQFKAEQVGYCCATEDGVDGHMEMSGGEFCGNATRAYGMLTAKNNGLCGKAHLTLRVSGCEHPVGVEEVHERRVEEMQPVDQGEVAHAAVPVSAMGPLISGSFASLT